MSTLDIGFPSQDTKQSNAKMLKGGDDGDISLLFFLAGANFWAILGHFWAIWAILGHFWAILGNFWAISWHFWTNLRKIQIFLRPGLGHRVSF